MRARPRWRRIVWGAAATCFASAWLFPNVGHGTIEEQRARLPPAAECDDEIVAGVWRSHTYRVDYREWTIFTLTIRRDPDQPSRLIGAITNHYWVGTPDDVEPPPCAQQSRNEILVSMDGRGFVTDDNRITFGGVGQWRLDQEICSHMTGGYNLDQFTGVIDPAILEFQAVNNDGGTALNEATVFRRIGCPPLESAHSPSVSPVPPSFYPDVRSGCSPL